jgi:hypothetical protein
MNGMARECHSVLVHSDLSRVVATRRPGLLLAQQAKHLPISTAPAVPERSSGTFFH